MLTYDGGSTKAAVGGHLLPCPVPDGLVGVEVRTAGQQSDQAQVMVWGGEVGTEGWSSRPRLAYHAAPTCCAPPHQPNSLPHPQRRSWRLPAPLLGASWHRSPQTPPAALHLLSASVSWGASTRNRAAAGVPTTAPTQCHAQVCSAMNCRTTFQLQFVCCIPVAAGLACTAAFSAACWAASRAGEPALCSYASPAGPCAVKSSAHLRKCGRNTEKWTARFSVRQGSSVCQSPVTE
jgi:hypothetical protein